MTKSILIFIPNSLDKKNTGYLTGHHRKIDDTESYYIVNSNVTKECFNVIGFVGKTSKQIKNSKDAILFINSSTGKINILNYNYKETSLVEIQYDYNSFKNSDVLKCESENYGKHFSVLTEELRKYNENGSSNGHTFVFEALLTQIIIVIDIVLHVLCKLKLFFFYSSTYLYFEERIVTFKWFWCTLKQERKLTPKLGNVLLANVLDLVFGVLLYKWFLEHEKDLVGILQGTMEDIIYNLKGLLLYLMGSPIGLKLNYSFNKSLGQFFFYHISLWRLFLQGINPIFTAYFRLLVLPGVLGISFQIAMFSDIISIATFHIFCIYVYAARLFNLQLRGLISLWRLFIGRKYNPLRERVDSCQYSAEQLFIGTLGFTILLFLLPTTLMYYTVFSVFRLLIYVIDGLMLRARYLLNAIPLYVLLLWVYQSPSVAGTLYINWVSCDEYGTTKIDAKLNILPLSDSIKKFLPDTLNPIKRDGLSYLFHCAVTGTLI